MILRPGLAAILVLAVALPVASFRQARSNPHTSAHMREHFAKVIEAHDAVVRGDLDSAKAPAEWLAAHDPTPELDKASASHVSVMRQAARRAADATDLATAAQGTAAMLAACGDCHRAAGVVPPMGVPAEPHVGGTVGHMLAHKHAIDLMMQGLIVPSAALWQQGAAGLKHAPLKASDLPRDPKLTRQILAAEDEVHLLAERAASASEQPARIAAYAQVISACGRCHGLHGRVWGPGVPPTGN
jgi:cytochrome c553